MHCAQKNEQAQKWKNWHAKAQKCAPLLKKKILSVNAAPQN
jgi:hypothetical protein